MKTFIKWAGLFFSAGLTMSLFVRLFGLTPYGIAMAALALVLFEGGSEGWAQMLKVAQGGQREIAKAAMWFCVVASVASSGAEIILATKLWKPPFDTEFITLAVIVGALAVNIMGIFRYEQLNPDTAKRNLALDRQARAMSEAHRLEDNIIDQSYTQAESKINEVAAEVADNLSGKLRDDVTNYLKAFGHHAPAPATQLPAPAPQTAQASQETLPSKSNEPSQDELKAFMRELFKSESATPKPTVQKILEEPREFALGELLLVAGVTIEEAVKYAQQYSEATAYAFLKDALPKNMTRANFTYIWNALKKGGPSNDLAPAFETTEGIETDPKGTR